jgi:hypothetical protein
MKSFAFKSIIALSCTLFLFRGEVNAQSTLHHCHTNNETLTTPISVMGNHVHMKGTGMVSINGMFMEMKDNIQRSSLISTEEIFNTYQVAPETMNMQMYMLCLMYGITDKLTLSAMGMYHVMDMQTLTKMQMHHSHSLTGIGDVKLSVIWGLRPETQIKLGINLPIGKFNLRPEEDSGHSHHHMGISYYPYCMQLGSGTPDILAGFNQNWSLGNLSGGIQANGTIRIGENNMGYRLGNSFNIQTWTGIPLSKQLGLQAKVSYFVSGKIKGQIEDINPNYSPPANPSNYERHIVNLSLGAKFKIWEKLSAGLEAGTPLFQYSSGIWMKEKYYFQAGLTHSF